MGKENLNDKPAEQPKTTSLKKDLQAKLVQSTKDGTFQKSARLRESLKNIK